MIKKPLLQISICLISLIAITGCNSSAKFDRQKWSNGNGLDYPLRDQVIDDLVKNHQLKGLTYRQVIDTLGSPQKLDSLQVSYQIVDNSFTYSRTKPIHKKNLILYFSKDSVVTRFEVYDHMDKKKKKS